MLASAKEYSASQVEAKYLYNRNNNTYIRIGLTTFADFLLSFFAEIRRRAISAVGCRSPPFNLDLQKNSDWR
ncbi:hypothetical protein DWW33_07480 [Roseburia sp. AF15-21]|nr:hypothetical protein DWW33_07480 [Roseburia sp. AF15-21]